MILGDCKGIVKAKDDQYLGEIFFWGRHEETLYMGDRGRDHDRGVDDLKDEFLQFKSIPYNCPPLILLLGTERNSSTWISFGHICQCLVRAESYI